MKMDVKSIEWGSSNNYSNNHEHTRPIVPRSQASWTPSFRRTSAEVIFLSWRGEKYKMVHAGFRYLSSVLALVIFQTTLGRELPRGHGEPIGKHRPPEGHVPVLTDLPSAGEFWEKYVSVRRPVVFRGPG